MILSYYHTEDNDFTTDTFDSLVDTYISKIEPLELAKLTLEHLITSNYFSGRLNPSYLTNKIIQSSRFDSETPLSEDSKSIFSDFIDSLVCDSTWRFFSGEAERNYSLIELALKAGYKIAPDKAAVLLSYYHTEDNDFTTDTFASLINTYISKTEPLELVELTLERLIPSNYSSLRPNPSYLLKKIIQNDRFDLEVIMGEDSSSTFLELIFNKIISIYLDNWHHDLELVSATLIQEIKSSLTPFKLNLLQHMLTSSLIGASQYDGSVHRRGFEDLFKTLCQNIGNHFFQDLTKIKLFCQTVEKQISDQKIDLEASELSYQLFQTLSECGHLKKIPFLETDTDLTFDELNKSSLIKELVSSLKDSSLYLSLLQQVASNNFELLISNEIESLIKNYNAEQDAQWKLELFSRLLHYVSRLEKVNLLSGDNDLYYEIVDLLDKHYFTLKEFLHFSEKVKNPFLYFTAFSLNMENFEDSFLKSSSTEVSFQDVLEEVTLKFDKQNFNYELIILACNNPSYAIDFGVPNGQNITREYLRESIINELSSYIYEELEDQNYENQFQDDTNYSLKDMLQDLESSNLQRLCSNLEDQSRNPELFNTSDGENLLFKAIETNNIFVVKQLISLGYDLSKVHEKPINAMEYAKEIKRSNWFIDFLEKSLRS